MVLDRKLQLLAGMAALALPLGATPALAGPAPCVVAGFSSGCQYLVTFNADGSVSLANQTATNGHTYDGSDDVEVGIVNNASGSLTGLHLTGSDIGDFEGDGINTYVSAANAKDTTGYGGPNTYFANNTGDALDALFIAALATGQSTYFSLEAPPSIGAGALTVTALTSVPEPGSVALLATALFGLFTVGRRRA